MVYGMTYDQFWYGDPWIAKTFREYYLLKRKVENENMWIQGSYFYSALQAVISTAFGKKREKYVTQPLDIFPKTKAEKDAEIRQKKYKLIRYLSSLKMPADKK